MPRHRGTYKPADPAPYELSRSAIEKAIKCEACFWLEKVRGVKTPKLPGFNLNTNTDTLLKKDFDAVRGKGPHPLMTAAGLSHLRPFWHEDIGKWADSLHFGATGRFHFDHPETNIRFGGGLDDVWENVETGSCTSSITRAPPSPAKRPSPSTSPSLRHLKTRPRPTTKLAAGRWTCISGLPGGWDSGSPTRATSFMWTASTAMKWAC